MQLAADFAMTSAERDLHRILPEHEVERLSASGLLAITVPAAYGGADVSTSTLPARSSACWPAATPTSRRSRTATSST